MPTTTESKILKAHEDFMGRLQKRLDALAKAKDGPTVLLRDKQERLERVKARLGQTKEARAIALKRIDGDIKELEATAARLTKEIEQESKRAGPPTGRTKPASRKPSPASDAKTRPASRGGRTRSTGRSRN